MLVSNWPRLIRKLIARTPHIAPEKLVVFLENESTDTKDWVRGDIGLEQRPDGFLVLVQILDRIVAAKEWEFARLNGSELIQPLLRAMSEYFRCKRTRSRCGRVSSRLEEAQKSLRGPFPKAAEEIGEALDLLKYFAREHCSWAHYPEGEIFFQRHIGNAILEILGR